MRVILSLAVAAVVLSACSASVSIGGGNDTAEDFSEAAVEVIEGLGEEGALAISETNCDLPSSTVDGSEFDCLSLTESGAAIRWDAEIDDGGISVNSTNLVTTPGLAALLDAVAALVSQETGGSYTAADLSCGEAPMVLDSSGEISCRLRLPDGGNEALIVTVTDTRSGDFSVRTVGAG